MEYLLKANAVIILFYLCYKLFLQKETFFESNRYFLLIGLAIASIIPFVVIPIYIEKTISSDFTFEVVNAFAIHPEKQVFTFLNVIKWAYLIGIIVLITKFLVELISLVSVLIKNKRQKQGGYIYIETQNEHSPFSFFKYIVYNPNHFTVIELEQIILHEKVHAKQYHSIDILLTKIASIIFWFNPFIWLYTKSLQQNLEFIADDKTQNKVENAKTYQTLLLKTSIPSYQLALTNNFYNSLIKKRIIMLHKSKSNKLNTWKYALILPVLALFLMSFNTKEVIIPIESEVVSEKPIGDIEIAIISKKTTDAELESIENQFKKQGVTLNFKSVKRNKSNEIIRLKISAESKNSKTKYESDSNDPIANIKIKYDSEDNSVSIGSESSHSNSFVFSSKGNKHKVHKSANVSVHYDNEEHKHEDGKIKEVEVIVKDGKHKIHKSKNGKNVYIIKKDGKEYSIDNEDEVEDVKIYKDKDGNVIKKEVVIIRESENTWTDEDETVIKLGDNKSSLFISTDGDEKPLIIIDGKQVSYDKLNSVSPNNIESVNVLKGETSLKTYGEKGENGVIIIKTKK